MATFLTLWKIKYDQYSHNCNSNAWTTHINLNVVDKMVVEDRSLKPWTQNNFSCVSALPLRDLVKSETVQLYLNEPLKTRHG